MTKYGGLTLQEIQQLPRSKMIQHMREHVDKDFLKEEYVSSHKRKFEIEALLINAENFDIYAESYSEALEEAKVWIEERCDYDDFEIQNIYDVENKVWNQ